MPDPRRGKGIKVGTIITAQTFENFQAIILIDAGSDGFKVEDADGSSTVIPTATPLSIAGPASILSDYLRVAAPDTGTLNVSYILYQ